MHCPPSSTPAYFIFLFAQSCAQFSCVTPPEASGCPRIRKPWSDMLPSALHTAHSGRRWQTERSMIREEFASGGRAEPYQQTIGDVTVQPAVTRPTQLPSSKRSLGATIIGARERHRHRRRRALERVN